jgi:hypothetical protein
MMGFPVKQQGASMRHVALLVFAGALGLTSPSAQSAATPKCAEIAGSTALLEPGALILLGEMHGTQEIPRFAGDLVCAASARRQSVQLGLELSRDEQTRIERYLASDGSVKARAELVDDPSWNPTLQDGRHSSAMADLIERVRVMQRARRKVEIVTLDVAASYSDDRDEAMAARVREIVRAHPRAITITLTGNIHNSLQPARQPRPMGSYLADLDPVALVAKISGGSTWACMPDCAEHELNTAAPTPDVVPWSIALQSIESDGLRWSGVFRIGTAHPSPPAIHALKTNAATSAP